jgi:hypothetical protein
MSMLSRGTIVGAVVAIGFAQQVQAQGDAAYEPFWQRPIHVGIDIGGSFPTGQLGNAFDPGWDLGGNIAWSISPRAGLWLQADVNYGAQLVKAAMAAAYGATGGGASVTSGVLNVVFNTRDYLRHVTPYVLAGGGMYWRYIEFDNYGGSADCSPFYGACSALGVTVPVVTRTQAALGWDAGAGLRFRLRPLRLFLEARYNTAYTRHGNTTYVPVVFGTEW